MSDMQLTRITFYFSHGPATTLIGVTGPAEGRGQNAPNFVFIGAVSVVAKAKH